jgi:microcystin-dependent protein
MSTCSNCYNGCTEIVSDRCVKYTGIDVPVLGIKTGDSLSFVEQALITFLTSTLDGTGVKIDLAPVVVCDLVKQYLPTCKDLSIVDISKALIQAACNLQLQVDDIVADIVTINNQLDTIEANYTVKCLINDTPSITPSSGTHAILQATIDTLCALALDLSTNYSSNGAQLDAYIANYLATNSPSSSLISNRMVPYAVVEYYGPVAGNFDGTGKGIGDWDKIYLCNGLNGTPDKRGVVGVGATNGAMLGLTMPAATNPSLGNPVYTVAGTIIGSNNVVLSTLQMPNHTHVPTVAFNDPKHRHKFSDDTTGPTNALRATNDIIPLGTPPYPNAQISADGTGSGQIYQTSLESTGITVGVTIGNEGGGQSHPNFQPGLGCLYIQYRP